MQSDSNSSLVTEDQSRVFNELLPGPLRIESHWHLNVIKRTY